MSKLGALRKRWNYEENIPRCETCSWCKRGKIYLINSLPRKAPPLCTKGNFQTKINSVCDNWESKKGEVLETNNEINLRKSHDH